MQDATRRPTAAGRWLAASLAGLFLAGPAAGASRVEVRAASIEGSGVRAHAVAASLQPLGGRGLAVDVRARRLEGIEPLGAVSTLHFACPRLAVSGGRLACADGRLAGEIAPLGPQDTPASLSIGPGSDWRLGLASLAVAGGTAGIEAEGRQDRWSAQVVFADVGARRLAGFPALVPEALAALSPEGTLAGRLDASGAGSEVGTAGLRASLSGLSFADEAGTLAGEQVAAELEIAASRDATGGGWQLAGGARASSGQAYVEPVFLDLAMRPATLEFQGVLAADASTLALSRFHASQPGVGDVEGVARIDLGGVPEIRHARARLRGIDLAGAWPAYGAPWMVGTPWADLQASGEVEGELDLEDGAPARVVLQLAGVTLDSVTGSLALAGLGGRFTWYSDRLRDTLAPGMDSAAFKSRLHWDAARLWGIEFGAASIPFTTTGNHFRLLDPVVLPVFDGGLAIQTLRIRHAGTPQMYLRFDAELAPVSLRRLTRSLGWPEFGGTLSGRIPRLELADGFVTLGGNLEATVFDGSVAVRNLRLRDPLGEYPQLFADIDVEGLDLEQVTSTFEFGMITGRLSGRVEGLETFDWTPVAFDAAFHSTAGDRSPRRIDQRAVSNLSSIGGGSGGSVTAALQGGFLRFFDSFRYERLGLSCRLANDVCHMDGVAPAETGYYIVKGSGLPRIDVIGNQRRVAWTRLVRQLAAITESGELVIE